MVRRRRNGATPAGSELPGRDPGRLRTREAGLLGEPPISGALYREVADHLRRVRDEHAGDRGWPGRRSARSPASMQAARPRLIFTTPDGLLVIEGRMM